MKYETNKYEILCTFLAFYTSRGKLRKIVSKCFLQLFKGFKYFKNIVF